MVPMAKEWLRYVLLPASAVMYRVLGKTGNVEPDVVEDALSGRTKYDLVAIVHSETSSGVFNPIAEVGNIVKSLSPNSIYLVDAVSSFGAVPVNFEESCIDVLISSANKCLQGVPGFAFVIARNSLIDNCKGNSRTLALDLYDQEELKLRANRYKNNRAVLQKGMSQLGFRELLDEKVAGYIITSYLYPKDPNFNFNTFYNKLNDKDLVIYPGKVLDTDCFRIGTIGDLHAEDMSILVKAVREVCSEMKISIPIKY
ncbi:hypothetical protein Btru_012456 [Bulinus truncatus]|nr:hypothetical protein Btru_012456 [Bulinus truncatus]